MNDEELTEILKFLSSRMNPDEKKALFAKLGVSSVQEISESPSRTQIIETLRIEKRKRTSVRDIKFTLSEDEAKKAVSAPVEIKAYKTHVDRCLGDED